MSAAALAATGGTANAEGRGVNAEALARRLPGGFRSAFAEVNGTTLHYVAGGQGEPLVLLPGWPQTWWAFHKIMPALASRYRVIAVDLRGMNLSGKPAAGYDKKTMAQDIYELAQHLGYSRINIAGHDIGAMVAFSYALNHADATNKVALLNEAHPDPSLYSRPLLSQTGAPNLWWFAFNQVSGLPEQVFAGRMRFVVDYMLDTFAVDRASIDEHDRQIYARAHDSTDAIRAGDAWYQAIGQDIADFKTYGKIKPPVLGLASPSSYRFLQYVWPAEAEDVRLVKVENSGHFLSEEQPAAVIGSFVDFFG